MQQGTVWKIVHLSLSLRSRCRHNHVPMHDHHKALEGAVIFVTGSFIYNCPHSSHYTRQRIGNRRINASNPKEMAQRFRFFILEINPARKTI